MLETLLSRFVIFLDFKQALLLALPAVQHTLIRYVAIVLFTRSTLMAQLNVVPITTFATTCTN